LSSPAAGGPLSKIWCFTVFAFFCDIAHVPLFFVLSESLFPPMMVCQRDICEAPPGALAEGAVEGQEQILFGCLEFLNGAKAETPFFFSRPP